jgi:hypothetical protein
VFRVTGVQTCALPISATAAEDRTMPPVEKTHESLAESVTLLLVYPLWLMSCRNIVQSLLPEFTASPAIPSALQIGIAIRKTMTIRSQVCFLIILSLKQSLLEQTI